MIRELSLQDTLDKALHHAVTEHFCKLFGVLMTDPKSPAAFERFKNGLGNLFYAYHQVEDILAEQREQDHGHA